MTPVARASDMLVLALGQFALVTSVFMIAGGLRALAAAFGVSLGEAAMAISAFSVTYAAAAPFLAAATGRVSAKAILVGALALFAAACFASPLVRDFRWLLVLRVVCAAADGLFAATATAVAAQLAPVGRKGRFLALVNGGVTLAFLIGVPLATALTQRYGWPAMFLWVGGLAAFAALGVAVRFPNPGPTPTTPLRARLAVLSRPGLAATLAVTAISYAGLFTVYTFSQPLLNAAGFGGVTSTPRLLFAFGLAAIAGNLAGGRLADAVGPPRVVIASLALLTALLAAIGVFLQSPSGAYLFFGLLGFLHYLGLTPFQYRVASLSGRDAGVGLALNAAATYLGVALAAQLGGAVMDRLGDARALGYVASVLKLSSLGLFLLSLRAEAPEPGSQTPPGFAG